MRYYTIIISDAETGEEVRRFSSLNENGLNNPSALNIDLDVPVYSLANPIGAAFIKIWGISIQDIGAAFDLNKQKLKLYAGMTKGLPLANPEQAGLILEGEIQQAFGNWEDTTQTLDLIVSADGGTNENPKNIILNWAQGVSLAEAIKLTLNTAFPEYTVTIDIDENIKLNQPEVGYFQTISQFAQYVKAVSINIIGGDYLGVEILVRENEFIVFDGSTQQEPLEIDFKDLIGQPTWIGLGQIQFKCVMRADLTVNDYVKLPKGQQTTTAQSYSQYKNQTDFKGVFQIDAVRFLGSFRQQDGGSWVTVFNAHVPAEQQATP